MAEAMLGAGDRVVAVANFYGPRTGGLRTALQAIGREYQARGLHLELVVPGARDTVQETGWGRVHTIGAPPIPGSGGYRLLTRIGAVTRLLERLAPARVELSDRSTLHGVARWAQSRGVPCLFIAHERLDGVLEQAGVPRALARAAADRRNAATAAAVPTIVATTAFAAAEFERIGVRTARVPLGVDLELFTPRERTPGHLVELVLCSRLARQKRPELAIATLREVCRRGLPARLTVVGHGPMRERLRREAAGLPVLFTGFETDRSSLRGLLAGADVALAPGPIETFGLAALEAMACGTPVVVDARSALAEVVGPGMAGRTAEATPSAFADAVAAVLALPVEHRETAARRRAETFSWQRTADALLALPLHSVVDRAPVQEVA